MFEHVAVLLVRLPSCWRQELRESVCVCDAQIFQIMLKLRGSTMMRPNHEFFCSVALSPGFRNWVEMTCVCVCVCVYRGWGRTILKREACMGPGPPAVA